MTSKSVNILTFGILLFGLSICASGQSKNSLNGSAWKGTQLPLKKGTELYFQGDTLVIVDLDGYNPADQYLTSQNGDTLQLHLIEENSFACRDETPAKYKIYWANNGEKLYLKPISDQCITRFTLIVSESPWFRKKEEGELRRDWYFLDPVKDGIPGISLYEGYNLLKFRKSSTITVAVIDYPADYLHEDLKEKIWINPNEIPDNNLDDDKNGFKDDLHGWFFNSSYSGTPIQHEQPVETQVYTMWKPRFDSLTGKILPGRNLRDHQLYISAKKEFEKQKALAKNLEIVFSDSSKYLSTLDRMLELAAEPVTHAQINTWILGDGSYEKAFQSYVSKLYKSEEYRNFAIFVKKLKTTFSASKKTESQKWLYDFNDEWNPRLAIKDHPEKPLEKMYGSGKINQQELKINRGTHLAGIIGAKRSNGKGTEGIADNVKIMTLGAVPESGNERDKDVANCIRYATDNGAKIINMSFSKRMSPFKPEVDAAVKYAESKGVLLIHAAGNDAVNADSISYYPTSQFENGGIAKNWIEVGNSTFFNNEKIVAQNSNFGKRRVDLFAPGTSIIASSNKNSYESYSGSEQSAAVVSGVAALIWSYFPKLTANELKTVLLESVFVPEIKEVNKPGTSRFVPFSSLSKSGGIINLKSAVFSAEKIMKRKKGR